MPVYFKSPGRWTVRVYHRGEFRTWVVKGTKDDAEQFEATKRLENRQRDPNEERVAPTFSDFCVERYKPWAQANLAPGTWRNRPYQIAELAAVLGDLKLTDFADPRHIERYVTARRERGIGPVTINDDLKVLRAILGRAREMKIPVAIPKMPRLRAPKKTGRVKAWSAEQIGWLFDACERIRPELLDIVAFVANTGVRKTEAIHVRWSSVDFKNGVIFIEPNEEWTPKDNEARAVPMNAALRERLTRLFEANKRRDQPSDYVFTAKTGDRWEFWPQRQFDRARKSAVSPAVYAEHVAKHEGLVANCRECSKHALKGGPHTLRHTYATHFLASKADLFKLSKILGHSHERTTLIYSHLLPGALAEVAEAVSFSPRSNAA